MEGTNNAKEKQPKKIGAECDGFIKVKQSSLIFEYWRTHLQHNYERKSYQKFYMMIPKMIMPHIVPVARLEALMALNSPDLRVLGP